MIPELIISGEEIIDLSIIKLFELRQNYSVDYFINDIHKYKLIGEYNRYINHLSKETIRRWKQFVIKQKKERLTNELLYSPYLPKWFENNKDRAQQNFMKLAN